MFRRLIPFILLLLVVSCATPYQKFELFVRGGYIDKKVSEDTYRVVYHGNNLTSMETVNTLLLYRSAELTVNLGYDYFVVLHGEARMPSSALGGFRTAVHTIKMHKGEPDEQDDRLYEAQTILDDFGSSIGTQK